MPNTVQCPSGHYFDFAKFRFCPFCGAPAVTAPVQQPEPQTAYAQPPMPPQPGQAPYGQPPMPPQPGQVPYGQPPMPPQSGQAAYGQPPMPPQPEQAAYGQLPMPPQPEQAAYGQLPMPPQPEQADYSQPTTPPAADAPVTADSEKNTHPTVGWLVGVEGPCQGKTYALREARNFIGRAAAMDVVLSEDDHVASTAHAIIAYVPKQKVCYAQPGLSRELYEVNGEAVLQATALSADDRLTIGASVFRFVPLCGDNFSWDKPPVS